MAEAIEKTKDVQACYKALGLIKVAVWILFVIFIVLPSFHSRWKWCIFQGQLFNLHFLLSYTSNLFKIAPSQRYNGFCLVGIQNAAYCRDNIIYLLDFLREKGRKNPSEQQQILSMHCWQFASNFEFPAFFFFTLFSFVQWENVLQTHVCRMGLSKLTQNLLSNVEQNQILNL